MCRNIENAAELTSRPISNPPPSPAIPMAEGADHPSERTAEKSYKIRLTLFEEFSSKTQ